MVVAEFKGNETTKYVGDVYQYDLGQVLCIKGLNLPRFVEIDFALQETGSTTESEVGIKKNGVTEVEIPNHMLINNDTDANYMIYAFVYLTDETSGETISKIRISVKARSKPENFTAPEDTKLFQEAIKAVNESAQRAESAEQQSAKYAEQTKLDAQQTTADRQEVEKLVDSVSGIGEQVEAAKGYAEQAKTAATNALQSEQVSKQAKESALQAQAGAETAADEAEQHALEVAGDKTEVERLATQVRQDKTAVEQTKTAIDKTAQDFTLAAQQAVADVNNAGQSQTERVQQTGQTAVENVQDARTQAVNVINTAKEESVKAVTDKGTEQTEKVTAEGEKQVQAVQTVAQEIIADREQIKKNATDIADLRQSKADAIVESANGTLINIKDSANAYFEDFSMLGKTTQDGTPTPDVFVPIVNAGESGNIEIKVTKKNLIPFPYPKLGGVGTTGINNGITYTVLEDRGIKITGKAMTTVYVNLLQNFALTDNKKYVYSDGLKSDPNNGLIFYEIGNGKTINETYYPQIEYGNVATGYEPYKEPQIVTITLEKPLTKWDRLEKRDGVYKLCYRGGKAILNNFDLKGSDEIIKGTVFNRYQSNIYVGEEVNYRSESLCSHLKYDYPEDDVYFVILGSGRIYCYFKNDLGIDTLQKANEWIAEHPNIEFKYYDSSKPEEFVTLPEETQTALNNLHTNYPTTIISNSEDCDMEVEYIADTKNYIDKQMQAIVTKQTETDRLILERTM